MNLKPIVKWAGGKRQIMKQITRYFPENYGNYYEPFAGGLSVFMELHNNGKLDGKQCCLSDTLQPLMHVYSIVMNSPGDLITELSCVDKYRNDKNCYIQCRKRFNELKVTQDLSFCESIEYAALFLYMNRTCFNGMYRENKKGDNNVPFGRAANPTICDTQGIMKLCDVLKHSSITLSCNDYSTIEDSVQRNDFVYLDPPYHSTFSQYNSANFKEKEHKELKSFIDILTEKGCLVVMSNSNTPFIRELYADYEQIEIPVKRIINCRAEDRNTPVTELLIRNFNR
jgi:DNA adenine methylase